MADKPAIDPELQAHIERVLGVQVPAGPGIALGAAMMRRWFKPHFLGLDKLPEQPALFVGNHSFLAADAFPFHWLLHYDHGRFLRPLGDRTLFANEHYANLVIPRGAAVGQPAVVEALMAAGKDILLYPGGTYEAVKSPENAYRLMWQERYGFIRLAAAAGYTIVPFAAVGPDEYFDQLQTQEQLYASPLLQGLIQLGIVPADVRKDLIPPIAAGVLGSPIPKPKTTYYGFCDPIDLSEHKGKRLSVRKLVNLRQQVADAIEEEIKALLLHRERNRHRDGFLRRLLSI